MTGHTTKGRGNLRAELGRVPKDKVTQPATSGAKKGLEVVRDKFQATAEHEPAARVVVWNHDANRVLFSGTPAEFETLKRAIAQEG
jgi:hypothetical protein